MARKLIALLFLMLFSFSFAFAQNDELFNYHALNLNLLISNKFDVVPTTTDYFVDYVAAELSWYPLEDYRQKVDDITTEPKSKFADDTGFLFEWKAPGETSFYLEERANVNAKNEFLFITRKVGFPIKDLDPDYSEYLQPQDIIDVNEDIRQKAFEVVQGEDDLYSAVFRIAEWVENNVDYDLSTITAEANQKASWVMKNKKGVCDEITSLFISMCRSLGIPARFVTGISYSNINLQNNGWGPHGWAEVYFPGFGWVPFDVTYKELGFVDATHIKLKTSLDSKETSINYETKSRNTDIKPEQLEFEVNVLSKDYLVKPVVELSAGVAEPETGFGSYNLLIVSVRNLKDYYATTRVGLANVNELEILDPNFQSVMLKPNEEKKLYWMMRVSQGLSNNYVYTFPLKLTATAGEKAEAEFRAAGQYDIFSEEYMNIFKITEQPETKPYSQNVITVCSVDKSKIYLDESINISCVVDNKGSQLLRNLKVCLDRECSTSRIPEQETSRYGYSKKFDTLGIKTMVFSASNELVEKSYYIIIDVQDKPLIEITNLTSPESMSYEDSSEISFFVKKKSNTNPRNVKVRVEHEFVREYWSVPELEMDYNFKVLLKGDNLNLNKNNFNIIITYEDAEGKQYSLSQEFYINLNNPTLWQKINIWLRVLEKNITNWFNNI